MAREAEVAISEDREAVDVTDAAGNKLRFYVPKLALTRDAVQSIDWEL
jgi:hypothetical protein